MQADTTARQQASVLAHYLPAGRPFRPAPCECRSVRRSRCCSRARTCLRISWPLPRRWMCGCPMEECR
jgi:hypothetical protein